MTKKIKEVKRSALFFDGGEQITDFRWTEILNLETTIMALNEEEDVIACFDINTGEKLCEIQNVFTKYCICYRTFIYVSLKNGNQAIYSLNGQLILSATNIEILKSIFIAEQDHMYSVYNFKGEDVLGEKYDRISANIGFMGLLKVEKGNLTGVYSYSGKKIVPIDEYSRIDIYSDHIDIWKYNLIGRYSTGGKLILSPIYNSIEDVHVGNCDTVFKVQKGDLFGIFSSDGKQILNIEYDEIKFQDKLFFVKKGDLLGIYSLNGNCYGMLSLTGKEMIPVE